MTKKKTNSAADDGVISAIISHIGNNARRMINEHVPLHERDVAWAAISAAIVGAALHDSQEPRKIMEMVAAVLTCAPLLSEFRKPNDQQSVDQERHLRSS